MIKVKNMKFMIQKSIKILKECFEMCFYIYMIYYFNKYINYNIFFECF